MTRRRGGRGTGRAGARRAAEAGEEERYAQATDEIAQAEQLLQARR